MSGRFQTHTVASEGTELDDNYHKMVADIEEQTQKSGWLFGRGAFDKADLQYLRDFNNSLRYKEVEIEDKEKALWERERARLDEEAAAAAAAAARQAAALTRRSSGSSAPGSALLGGPVGGSSRPAPLLLPVKVKPAGSKATPRQQSTSPTAAAGEQPSCKRARTDSAAAATNAHASPFPTAAALSPADALRSVKSEPSPAAPSLRGSLSAGADAYHGAARPPAQHQIDQHPEHKQERHQQQSSLATVRAQSSPEAGARDVATAGSGQAGDDAAAPAAGLANLLGGYGSEDDEVGAGGEDDGGNGGGGAPIGASAGGAGGGLSGRGGGSGAPGGGFAKLPPPVGLLSPEELLADPKVIAEGLLATRPQPQSVQGGDAWDSEERSGSESDPEA